MTTARVNLWGSTIGAVTWLNDRGIGVFQYTPEFVPSGIELSPLMMPLRAFPYEFPSITRESFMGLPGMLSDALPDTFGNAVIDAWLASRGRTAASFDPVERLCYVGARGMGALEFEPATLGPPDAQHDVEVARLVDLAHRIVNARSQVRGVFSGEDDQQVIDDILRVGTSAGGARAKAILAWNPQTGEFRSGQLPAGSGFEYWMMKFDGVESVDDVTVSTPLGFGKVEYAYALMARRAGIDMTACRLHHEGGRSHFMTKRFDRRDDGTKWHMQTLGAMAHLDYRRPDVHSYEQAIQVCRRLGLPRRDLEQLVLRAFFNVMAKNCDDHVKNMAFLMDRSGTWRLAPAYDMTFAWNPDGIWTHRHQMSINGKRDAMEREDLLALAADADIKAAPASDMVEHVAAAVRRWPECAAEAGISDERTERIQETQQTDW